MYSHSVWNDGVSKREFPAKRDSLKKRRKLRSSNSPLNLAAMSGRTIAGDSWLAQLNLASLNESWILVELSWPPATDARTPMLSVLMAIMQALHTF